MKIEDFLQKTSSIDEPMCDPEFQRLLDGKLDTTAATQIWTEIADGSASVESALLWVMHVAKQIKANVINGAERDAAPAALRAIGFYGQSDPYRAARKHMDVIASFDAFDEQGQPISPRRMAANEWLKHLRQAGYLTEVSEKSALNRINEWRKELGIN